MGVRNIFPDSIAFVVTLQTDGRALRVEIVLDLKERLIFIPSGILPEIVDRLNDFTAALSDIAANLLAQQKWDGKDSLTEYQPIEILPNYQRTRSHLRFSVILEDAVLLPVTELDQHSGIRLV
jgi:hypothetical protein